MQVLIRTRPLNDREADLAGEDCNLQQWGAGGLQLAVEGRNYSFEFDEVLGRDAPQEDLFQRVPAPRLVCLLLILLARRTIATFQLLYA